jgi:hypothetical protein
MFANLVFAVCVLAIVYLILKQLFPIGDETQLSADVEGVHAGAKDGLG